MSIAYNTDSQIVNLLQGLLYINGAVVSNDATTPNTVLDISPGIMRDSTNTYDLNLGNFNGQNNPAASANSVTLLNAAVVGLNGIDTGSLGVSKVYYVYCIADPVNGLPSGVILSLAQPSVGPLLPFGYSVSRHIGFAMTNSSSHFLVGYSAGAQNARIFAYDAPQATAVTAGAATSYTAVDLNALVPANYVNLPVNISYAFTPNAAGDTLKMQPLSATGDAVTITGQVTTVIISGINQVMAHLNGSGHPEINYKVSSGSDAVAIDVAGFHYYV